MTRPLCFVLMPYHATVENGQAIDFPKICRQLIEPAIEQAGMQPLLAKEDPRSRGFFQKAMYERLILCEFAVAELSTGNANVYYELGVRHALRPRSTVLLYRRGWRLPLDVASVDALDYPLTAEGEPKDLEETKARLVAKLDRARGDDVDSPIHQLLTGLPTLDVDHARIDDFREHADRDAGKRRLLDDAVRGGAEALRTVERQFGELDRIDARTALSLVLAYRSTESWEDIVRVVRGLAAPVARVELVRQQYAWALNRCGQDGEAERVLQELIRTRPSSESYGLLGRVLVDRWTRASGKARRSGLLGEAIKAYRKGFETDWRDPYPGVNAVTLMYILDPEHPELSSLLPVVRYASERRLSRPDRDPDYWDHATDLGLSVLSGDRANAWRALECAVAVVQDPFQLRTTARSLRWLAEADRERGRDVAWLDEIIHELESGLAQD